MRTIESIFVSYETRLVHITLNGNETIELSLDECAKLASLNLDFINKRPMYKINLHAPSIYSPGIQKALSCSAITMNEAPLIQEYTDKGWANANASEVNNPLYNKFPHYWNFLVGLRASMGDPNIV